MNVIDIDGSHGEGGGQILRTALSLSMVTGCPFRMGNIRASRPRSGLMPQHLAAIWAAARLCQANVSGDQRSSQTLAFAPRRPPAAGSYLFDIAQMAGMGSAGAVTLVLQTLLVPLAFAGGTSTLVLRGGTHVPWTPPFDHLAQSYLPALRRMGLEASAELNRWGWYPVGQGEIVCKIRGTGHPSNRSPFRQLNATTRGPLKQITGRAVAANLPAHIAQRMADRAWSQLSDLNVPLHIEPQRASASCPGAGIFLAAEYEEVVSSFSAYGHPGKRAEQVADEAVHDLREHHFSSAAIEVHLSDQLLLPLSLASGLSQFSVPVLTSHLKTNAWTIGQFGIADISMLAGSVCCIEVRPCAAGAETKQQRQQVLVEPEGLNPATR